MSANTPELILDRERDFFDREASQISDDELRIAPDQIERYRRAKHDPKNEPKDAMFATILPLAGKRVVDYGCGTGDLACELALCGAEVTAFDLSPESVAKAKRRAELHGVADRMTFHVCAAGATNLPSGSFDVATGAAVLHHLHTELPLIAAELHRLLTPDGVAVFKEPVANSALLRGLRKLTPVPTHATPDERQLQYADFEPFRAYFPRLEFQHYYGLERFSRVLGRWFARPARRIDYRAQRVLPWLRRFYGITLFVARR
jgi:2-polyprenyl-3-methyl-5-hydroxy-6-metoxy-1,4-benzoquinol methylase